MEFHLMLCFRGPGLATPFNCSQCGTDFTPVWKWEKPPTRKGQSSNATFHNITGMFIFFKKITCFRLVFYYFF